MAKKTTTLGAVSDINVTPMVDVMLVLLIIFMVITPMLQKGVSVNMAKATNTRDMQDADKEDAVVLAITRDGKIYLGSDPIEPDQITTKVKDRLSSKLDKTVYVKSDARREVWRGRHGGGQRPRRGSGLPGAADGKAGKHPTCLPRCRNRRGSSLPARLV